MIRPEPRVWSSRNPDGSIRWTWYTLADFLACRRRFKHGVIDDVVPLLRAPVLSTGSAFHYGQEAGFTAVKEYQAACDEPLLGACHVEAINAVDAYPYCGEESREVARRLAQFYWSPEGGAERDLSEWRILGIEKTLTGRIGGSRGVTWGATVDLLVEVGPPAHRQWHGIWTVNWKTASDLRQGTFGWARRDGQFLSEQLAARAAGIETRGMILAVVTKTKNPTYTRDYVEWPARLVDDFAVDVLYNVRVARNAMSRKGPWPQNYNSCSDRYGPCRYWDLCEDGEMARGCFGTRAEAAMAQSGDPIFTLDEDW